jgi:hypothetical protein
MGKDTLKKIPPNFIKPFQNGESVGFAITYDTILF